MISASKSTQSIHVNIFLNLFVQHIYIPTVFHFLSCPGYIQPVSKYPIHKDFKKYLHSPKYSDLYVGCIFYFYFNLNLKRTGCMIPTY